MIKKDKLSTRLASRVRLVSDGDRDGDRNGGGWSRGLSASAVGVCSRSRSVHDGKRDQLPVDEYDADPSHKTQGRIEHPLKRTFSCIPYIPCIPSAPIRVVPTPPPPMELVNGGIRSVSDLGSISHLRVGQVVWFLNHGTRQPAWTTH